MPTVPPPAPVHRPFSIWAHMELEHIVDRFAEGLKFVDLNSLYIGSNQRTGATYLPGVPTMPEINVSKEVLAWWVTTYPDDFSPSNAQQTEVSYKDIPRAKCDIVFSSDGNWPSLPEWAIEVKRIQFVGDNGKNNDYNVPKILSPYLKDRSLIHDIRRMRDHPIARFQAVVGYAFSYDFETCKEALNRHPDESARVGEIRRVCRTNDPVVGVLKSDDLINNANLQFKNAGVVNKLVTKPFSDLWRHPCGGKGNVFAWQVEPAPRVPEGRHQG